MTKHIRWNEIPTAHLNPLLERQFISTEGVTLARFRLRKGVVVPEHSHANEQLAYVLEGALKFTIEGKEVVVRTGEVLCIPPHVPHMAEALEDTIDLDVFVPARTDWKSQNDQYLRVPK
jgi:quercetin dioxygenase-like cupin family protein